MPETLMEYKSRLRKIVRKYSNICCHCEARVKEHGYPWCEKCKRFYALLERARLNERHFYMVLRRDPANKV